MKKGTSRLLIVGAVGVSFFSGILVSSKADPAAITRSLVLQSEQVLGLDLSPAEADSMISDLQEYRDSYAQLRRLKLSNDVSPALVFNPLPPGYRFPDSENKFRVDRVKGVTLPANPDDLAYYTLPQLGELLRTRKISSRELTSFYISRLKKYNPTLFFAVTITEELALQQADRADAEIRAGKYKGPLHGIPYGVKDLLAVKGYKTTWGSVPYKDQVIDADATVVKRLEAAGAVLCAKLTLGELAMGDVWFGGRTRNPWDLKRGSSGSSAGSASAVSAGCLPFAIGSETWGSITSPSTECGVTGLRPTFGRIPKSGAMALSWSMDKLGPIARTVEDCAIVFQALKGADGQDMSAVDAPFAYSQPGGSLNGYRIGYLESEFRRNYPNRANDSVALAKLESLGARLVPLKLPDLPVYAMSLILSAEAGAAFQELVLSNRDDLMVKQDKGAWPNTFRGAQFISAAEYINANRARSILVTELNKMIGDLDGYVSPTSGNNSITTNLSGHPCVVVPNGTNRSGRLTSMTFIGRLFGEGRLLQMAGVYQSATTFHTKHPSLNQ
jgi:Asp-tRNA(Asn)/Glu-tRNA(Gln) amidotransferase A subunit family amidase